MSNRKVEQKSILYSNEDFFQVKMYLRNHKVIPSDSLLQDDAKLKKSSKPFFPIPYLSGLISQRNSHGQMQWRLTFSSIQYIVGLSFVASQVTCVLICYLVSYGWAVQNSKVKVQKLLLVCFLIHLVNESSFSGLKQ